ncbi:MAG TPA: hypothetical protein VJU59_29750 [Paraburkholderia sp.]|uniref:hypothetical protein n=1 Tax=Paraburkholderia sp. TaxID=1926495 RepID=UPI002B494292|nr:hypothetical protein [Paraburkholderia sp.]HKR43811.1 hypothetical protein [Paraburkholderia sp.]
MGRGLSVEQRALLGLACAVNRETQDGNLRVKTGNPVEGYSVPTVAFSGPRDIRLNFALWAIGGFMPYEYGHSGDFQYRQTPEYLSAKSSMSRALTRLVTRGLLVHTPWLYPLQAGYLLTGTGIEAGAAHENAPVRFALGLRAFSMVRTAERVPEPFVPRGTWDRREYWENSLQSDMVRDAIRMLTRGEPDNGCRYKKNVAPATDTQTANAGASPTSHQPIDVTVNEVTSGDRINRYRGDVEDVEVRS